MYVIIDWHILSDGNPNTYVEDAKEFFTQMALKYAGQVIPVIRQYEKISFLCRHTMVCRYDEELEMLRQRMDVIM